MSEFTVRKPEEGAHTLVAQFLAFRLDRVLEKARLRLGEDVTEEAALSYLERRYPDASETLRGKVAALILGRSLPDDFLDEDIEETEDVDDHTLRLTPVGGTAGWELGELLFYRSSAWVLVSVSKVHLVLKQASSGN